MEKQTYDIKYIISELLNRDEGACWMSEKELEEYRNIMEFGDTPRFNVISNGEYFAIYLNNGQVPFESFEESFIEPEVFDGNDWNEDFFRYIEGEKAGYAKLEKWGKINGNKR